MRSSEFLAWRKSLGLTQQNAARELGVSRATIQNWEKDATPIPRMVELACNILTRRWRKRAEHGPVLLIDAAGALPIEHGQPSCEILVHCQAFTTNEAALDRLRITRNGLHSSFVLARDGGIVLSRNEILKEIKRRKRKVSNSNTAAGLPRSGPLATLKPRRRLLATSGPMDIWEFKKWRREARLSQVEAADALGVSRGAIQHWECERSPIPRAAALACEEIASRRRLVNCGPLVLFQVAEPLWPESEGVSSTCSARCELLSSGKLVVQRALEIRKAGPCAVLLAIDLHGYTIWDAAELFSFEPHEDTPD